MHLKNTLLIVASLVFGELGAAPDASLARRFFDFTPVAETNPVVAKIAPHTEIPASEYYAFKKAEKPNAVTDETSLAQKKAVLAALIDEYLLVEEAYRLGADKLPGFTKRMEYTETVLLSEFLTVQEVDSKAKTAEEYSQRLEGLQNRLMDAATIDVSSDAFEQVKQTVKAIEVASRGSLGPIAEAPEKAGARLRTIMEKTNDAVLAQYIGKQITVKQILVIYARQPVPRPALQTVDELTALLKPLIVTELMAAEAKKEGLDALPAFQNKLVENRNALLRMHMHGLIEAQANHALTAPDREQQMKAWYKQNAEHYAVETTGVKTTPAYAELRERVEGDYSIDLIERLMAEKLRHLRQTHPAEINETVLQGL